MEEVPALLLMPALEFYFDATVLQNTCKYL